MESTAFIFAGQGAQFPGMGADIAASSPSAQAIFSQADAILGYSISDICFRGTLEDLTPCRICQPAIFTVSRAMRAAYGETHPEITAAICGGLSLGEFSAACEAGIFDFETGLKLVAERGRLMDSCCQAHPGTMAAILGCTEASDIQPICDAHQIDIANFNCPGQMVISGETQGVAAAVDEINAKGYRAMLLTVAGAYHSRLMAPAAEAFGDVLANAPLQAPAIPFLQNVTGTLVSDVEAIRRNLQLQVSSSVRWEECATYITQHSQNSLEFGPGNVLTKFMKRINRQYPAAAPFLKA